MANKTDKKQEKFRDKLKRSYENGYVQGYEQALKETQKSNRFAGAIGYGKGQGDRKKIDKIKSRVEKYKKRWN